MAQSALWPPAGTRAGWLCDLDPDLDLGVSANLRAPLGGLDVLRGRARRGVRRCGSFVSRRPGFLRSASSVSGEVPGVVLAGVVVVVAWW